MQATREHVRRNFTRDDLKELTDIDDTACISIYMPTELASATAGEARIRLKNLLRQAEKSVEERGWQKKGLLAMIDEGRRLMANEDLWRHRSEGLAIFITPERFRYHRLPVRFEESVTVATRFRVKPLMPLFMADGRFYLLALSQAAIRLFECTRHSVLEIEVEELPDGIDAFLDYDTKQSQLQHHAGDVVGGGRPAIFHGHGVSIDDGKDEILRYFQEVDRALAAILPSPEVPLVLAGVDYLIPIFREATTYRWVLPEAVSGNPDTLRAAILHEKALEIVRPELEQKQREAEARYRDLAGKGTTAAGVREVVPAAANGRVDTLFVSLEERRPGIFDKASNAVIVADDQTGEDLLDLAAVQTIRHGGSVYAINSAAMPEKHAAAAAILRY